MVVNGADGNYGSNDFFLDILGAIIDEASEEVHELVHMPVSL
jgi:hypothetical protein